MVFPVHTGVPGRARLRVSGLYRSEPLRHHIESSVSSSSGICRVSASVLTGNVLVFYNSAQTVDDVVRVLTEVVREYRMSNGAGGGGRTATVSPLHMPKSAEVKRPCSSPGESAVPKTRRKLRNLVARAEVQDAREWHRMDPSEVVAVSGTDIRSGLSSDEAMANLRRFGPNLLPESVPRSGWSIFFGQFKSLPVALLGVAAGISVLTGGIGDALVIGAVVLINATIGYATESGSEKTINSLKHLVRPTALLLRNGRAEERPAEEVTVADVLILKPGVYVAADARVVMAHHLSVDESALTGESLPVQKTVDPIDADNIPLADRMNMVYMGTLVTGGHGMAVVVGTGSFTEMGRIQTLVGEARPPETPMERQLDRIGNQLVLLSGLVCGLVFLVGLLRGYGFLEMLRISISLAVAAVPEGLPTVATTTLALGIRNMRRLKVLIRHLEAVETLGSVQTVCFDKTGTITLNRMAVREIHVGMQRFTARDGHIRRAYDDARINPYEHVEVLQLIHAVALCNESHINGEEGAFAVTGSPTENALVHLAMAEGIDVRGLRTNNPLLKVVHRSEKRNIMVTYHRKDDGGGILAAIKGSPREVLSLCSRIAVEGEIRDLSDDDRLEIEIENERMAGKALRILGVAIAVMGEGEVPEDHEISRGGGLVWLGIVGMSDPVRPGVRDLVAQFHTAGIETVMITGDQTPTAHAIARELNLSRGEQIEILDSRNLAEMPPDVLRGLARSVHVFARVSPAHKLRIVQSLQTNGRIIAMTGDGINDGPALKAADIGVAMGNTGTDVAREVADVVLEDDNLQTMLIAISQGRTIYNNIRKSIHFLLSTNISEIMVTFVSIAGGAGHTLSTIQLLWINLMSDIAPGLALSLEPPEPDVLMVPPRDPAEPIVKREDFKKIALESSVLAGGSLAAYGYGLLRYGRGMRPNSLAFLSLTLGQLLHAVSCRSERHGIFSAEKLPPNRYLSFALAVSLGLQVFAVMVPGLRGFLGIAPLTVTDGLVVASTAAAPLLINEAIKTRVAR